MSESTPDPDKSPTSPTEGPSPEFVNLVITQLKSRFLGWALAAILGGFLTTVAGAVVCAKWILHVEASVSGFRGVHASADGTPPGAQEGDLWFDLKNAKLWGPKAGDWRDSSSTSLRGPKGRNGVSGDTPVGAIVAWPAEEIPPGWLICDGRSYTPGPDGNWYEAGDITKQADVGPLAELLAREEGGGFALPDYRGYFLRGADDRRGPDRVDSEAPRQVGSSQGCDLQRHEHEYSAAQSTVNNFEGRAQASSALQTADTHYTTPQPLDPNNHLAFPGAGHETRPKNVAIHWIIYTGRVGP